MNAIIKTQVIKTDKQIVSELIDVCHKQNELIFSTRKRIYNLEHDHKITKLFYIVTTLLLLIGLAVING